MVLALTLSWLEKAPPELQVREGAKALIIAALGGGGGYSRRSGPLGLLSDSAHLWQPLPPIAPIVDRD